MRLSSSIYKLLIVCLFSYVIAADNFAGIGVALYKSSRGATVAAIAKGSPAASSDLRVGDCVIRVDGINVKGMSLVEIRNLIRGYEQNPVSIDVLRERDSLSININRINMSVVNVKDSIEAIDAVCYQCELLDVVSTKDKNAGFYVKKETNFAGSVGKSANSNVSVENEEKKSSLVSLIKMTRKNLRIRVKNDIPINITLFTIDGGYVKSKKNVKVGRGDNSIVWDNTSLPKGQYVVQVIQNEKKYIFFFKL